MLKSILPVLILLFTLSFGSGEALARHIEHCALTGQHSEATAHAAVVHDGMNGHAHVQLAADTDALDVSEKSCNQHTCVFNLGLAAVIEGTSVAPSRVDGPTHSSELGLSRPETLYRPPEV